MFQSLRRRLSDGLSAAFDGGGTVEEGFSLVELMVVLLIIAILLAVAIPTFLGVSGSANDRSAQSNLSNGVTEATSLFHGNGQSYSGISTLLVASAPELSWVAAGTTPNPGSNQVSVNSVDVSTSGDTRGVVMAAQSKNGGMCWYIAQLNATPAAAGIASTGFDTTGSGTGFQSSATTAGTYYAKSTTTCKANYPESKAGGFTWGPSYASAGVD